MKLYWVEGSSLHMLKDMRGRRRKARTVLRLSSGWFPDLGRWTEDQIREQRERARVMWIDIQLVLGPEDGESEDAFEDRMEKLMAERYRLTVGNPRLSEAERTAIRRWEETRG